ncbi:hypothetical protein [Mumia sp. DW29H23]|uniref:hypothetical protein n=1 Tax=Mumia sp. DW29H23 TaxID=3421241 RepID=UPI003D68C714
MNDDELRRRLDALASRAPDEDALLERWEKRSRGRPAPRSRTAPVLAVLVAATVVAVAGVALSGLGDRTTPDAADTGRSRPGVTAKVDEASPDAGTRLAPEDPLRVSPAASGREIGRGRLVVTVPTSWQWERPTCGTLSQDGYFFSIGVFQACAPAPTPHLTVVRIDSLAAFPHDDNDPVIDATRDGVAFGVSRSTDEGVDTAVVLAPDQDVRIVVRGSSAAVDRVLASLRVLPADEVAVPEVTLSMNDGAPGVSAPVDLEEIQRRVTRAGLVARVRAVDGATKRSFDRVRVTPGPGSVVPVGSTVQVDLVGAGDGR